MYGRIPNQRCAVLGIHAFYPLRRKGNVMAQMNKKEYDSLLREDIEWTQKQKLSLELEHILQVLKWQLALTNEGFICLYPARTGQ